MAEMLVATGSYTPRVVEGHPTYLALVHVRTNLGPVSFVPRAPWADCFTSREAATAAAQGIAGRVNSVVLAELEDLGMVREVLE